MGIFTQLLLKGSEHMQERAARTPGRHETGSLPLPAAGTGPSLQIHYLKDKA